MSVIDLEQSIKSHASFPGKTGNIQCAGGNPAGLRRCWCHSLHEYKAEISSQLWKQALRAICPCQCVWGSLMSQISVCDPLHPLCVWPSAHTPRLLLCSKESCSELPYTIKKAVTTSKTSMTRCLLTTAATDINPKRMANQQVLCSNKNDSEQPFYPHRNFCEQNQILELANLPGKTSLLFCGQHWISFNMQYLLGSDFFEYQAKFSFWLPVWGHSWTYFFFHCFD